MAKAMQRKLDVSFDRFIRTSDADHYEASKEIWRRMNESGDIYLGTYAGWYSIRDERFFAEDETEVRDGGARFAIETGTAVALSSSDSVFHSPHASHLPCQRL